MMGSTLPLHDVGPETGRFLEEALLGLRRPQKELPCKYFYDERGSELFDRICEIEEYYPTRTELGIMELHAAEMAALLGASCMVIEFGSGSSLKTRVLLDALESAAGPPKERKKNPLVYVPIDISREHLLRSAQDLARSYPGVEVLPVCADFTEPFDLPTPRMPVAHRVVYFPGSTIGNFGPDAAAGFLRRIATACGGGGGLLIGVDLKKDPAILERAYDDAEGVTRDFNLNLLVRMNRELGTDFRVDKFSHRAVYDRNLGRVEMHLVSRAKQSVRLGEERIEFREGEAIRTECSYKYSLDQFRSLADRGGLDVRKVWTDPDDRFSVQYLAVR